MRRSWRAVARPGATGTERVDARRPGPRPDRDRTPAAGRRRSRSGDGPRSALRRHDPGRQHEAAPAGSPDASAVPARLRWGDYGVVPQSRGMTAPNTGAGSGPVHSAHDRDVPHHDDPAEVDSLRPVDAEDV